MPLICAGNDSEGRQYGAIGTPEQYGLKWTAEEADDSRFKRDKYVLSMCRTDRLIELRHACVRFDGGGRKRPRAPPYFGVKAAQAQAGQKKGGSIGHTQGSAKSLVMGLFAKWRLEHTPNARVAIRTDRDELDQQRQGVCTGAGAASYRPNSGRDLMRPRGQARPRLLGALVHTFGRRAVDDLEAFITELAAQPHGGRGRRLRGRVPPYAARQAAPRDAGVDA